MSDQDWLENGHGGGESLRPMIKGESPDAFDRVSIRSVLRGTEAPRPRGHSRRNKALVGWLVYCAVALGGTAAAFSVRDTLFPALGAPTDNRVWPNPTAVNSTLTTEHGAASTAQAATTAGATLAPTTITATAAVVQAETVPTVSNPSQGPSNSIDNSGPGSGAVPAPGTTVDDSSKGPGPGTTVAENPTDTSTPSSASTPPRGGDEPVTSASAPADPATGNSSPSGQNGKGKGGGDGGSDPSTP